MENNTHSFELPILGTATICPTGTKTSNIRQIVMQGREMKILPSSVWNNFPWEEVRMLMHETATYVLPTEELISFLDDTIGDKTSIEICAGNKHTHKDNPLMDIPHEEIILPGLITRSSDPASNRIFIGEH